MYDIATKPRERAIMLAVVRKGADPDVVREHLDELALLLDTAGADVATRVVQERERPEVATALGKGKVEEVKELITETGASMVVFDDDLSPVQVRNLEKAFNVKVLDRAGVILDIFASRARSAEARTQVELAQLEYLFPRLTRMWTHLSKQFGGVGTKGPGETQIETDRRMYRTRIQRLREKLREIDVQRAVQRQSREGIPRFALVGYTNAGKSSLLKSLTDAEVYIENRLFATLDTTVRAFELPSGQRAVLSDTVGFIRKLPAQLVASFRSTLAEAAEADVIVHVADVTSPHVREHIDVVNRTLVDLGISQRPILMTFNKVDALEDRLLLHDLEAEYPGCVFVSAERGINLQRLLARMQECLEETSIVQHLLIPYDHMRDVSHLYSEVEVLLRDEVDAGVRLAVRLPSDKLNAFQRRYAAFVTASSPDPI
ncbi:MAG: GTPase HflX [Candidatus Kapabacteria bacterium]|nr:GTPase HflX [Candidatus Kapabacteria bacterium]